MTTPTVTSVFHELPGLRMHTLVCGNPSSPLALFLHGFPELSESWREILPQAADAGFYAVAPDLRGYGQTDQPDEGYEVTSLVQDIRHLMQALGRQRACIVGHDWGGLIAYHLAAHHPELTTKLCVVNCPHPAVFIRRVWMPQQLFKSWYVLFFQMPWLPERMLTQGKGSAVARLIRAASVDRSRLTREKLKPYAENFATLHAARCAVNYYRSNARRSRRFFQLPPIQAPFRLVWCEEDTALSLTLTRNLDGHFAGSHEVHYIPSVGHFGPLEAPQRVGPAILEHLRD